MREFASRDARTERAIRKALYLESIVACGRTSPNPPVACVAAGGSGEFLFRGSTEPPGGRHAEIVTLDRLDADPALLRGLSKHRSDDDHEMPGPGSSFDSYDALSGEPVRPFDLSVTLEPCSRYGRTPPCTLRISHYARGSEFAHQTGWALRRVSIGYTDPSLDREGWRHLERTGLSVEELASPSLFRPFLLPFFQGLRAKRPVFVVKIATDAGGLIGLRGRSVNLSGPAGRILTMRLRARCDAVLVGPGTTAIDRPSLDLRVPLTAEAADFHEHSSFDWLNDDVSRHPLSWFRGLFEGEGSGWDRMERDPVFRRQYQPTRVFLLGRPFPGQNLFFDRQRTLEAETGRPAVFLALHSCRSHWPDHSTIPDADDPAFLGVLGEELAGRGLQRILVESGKGMLARWARVMGPEDCIVHVRSSHTCPVDEGETPLRLDDELSALPLRDQYEFAPGLTADLYGPGQYLSMSNESGSPFP